MPRPLPLLLWPLLASGALGCDEPDRGVDGGCTSPREPFEQALEERWSDPNACASHDECIVAPADLVCGEELVYTGCARAIHRDSQGAFETVIDGIRAEQCRGACGYAWSDCFGAARCIGGRCALTTDYDAGFGDGGANDASVSGDAGNG